jgi:hypothetical protein
MFIIRGENVGQHTIALVRLMAFDYIFKRVMEDLLKSCGAKAEKVGTLPLEIDTVARCKGGQPIQTAIPLFAKHFASDNLFEYKSEVDKVNKENLSKLLGYVGLYGDQHGIGIHEMRVRVTAWYISAKRPGFLDELLASKIAIMTSDAGVYEVVVGFPCPCRVVVCDELDEIDDNIPLLFFGSVPTIKNAISRLAHAGPVLRQAMSNVKCMIYLFYRDEVKDMVEMKEISIADIRRNIIHTIEDLGIEETINEIGIEKVIGAVGVDKVIDAVGVDKVIDAVGIEKLKEAIARREAGKKPAKKAGKTT